MHCRLSAFTTFTQQQNCQYANISLQTAARQSRPSGDAAGAAHNGERAGGARDYDIILIDN